MTKVTISIIINEKKDVAVIESSAADALLAAKDAAQAAKYLTSEFSK